MIEAIKSILPECRREYTENNTKLIDKQSKMTVQLKNLPQNGLLIHVPGRKAHLGMISSAKDVQQSCDKLILIDQEEHVDVYFIEMKKTFKFDANNVPAKAAEQILHTTPALAYIVSMAKVHCDESKKTRSHFIIIAQKIEQKQGVRASPPVSEFQYKNEKFKMISSLAEISLKHL